MFADPDGGFDVVDWKTGQPPRTKAEKDAVAVQLAAYRLAWAALAGVPLDQVRAAFYYVRHDHTVRPADLLDAGGPHSPDPARPHSRITPQPPGRATPRCPGLRD